MSQGFSFVRSSFVRSMVVLAPVLIGMTALAQADEWKKTFSTQGRPEIRVNTNDASIEVRATDRKDTEIRVVTRGYEIGENKVRVTDHQNGDTIDLDVHQATRLGLHIDFKETYIHVEVDVPREANLNLHSGDGHIRVDDVKGNLQLDTGDGHIEANRVDGKLHARTSDGHMTIEGRFDDLDLRTSDGRVDATVNPGSVMSNPWSIQTGDGRVDLRLPETMSADLDLHTDDGRVTVDLPLTVSGEMGHTNVRGKLNAGGFELRVHTSDGGIHLGKI